jgi:hypothetical protein
MHDAMAETERSSPERRPSGRSRISLATSLVIVAAIAASFALVVEIRRNYAALPSISGPRCPEVYATPAVLLWILLGSTATFAWRRCSVTRLAVQVAVSCVLVISRLRLPADDGMQGVGLLLEVLWPLACFGAFFVTPLLLSRFSRVGDVVLVLADSSVVALVTYLFAVQPYVPRF